MAFGWMLGDFPHGRRRQRVYRTLPCDRSSHCCKQVPNNTELPWLVVPDDRVAAAVTLPAMSRLGRQGPSAIRKALKKQLQS